MTAWDLSVAQLGVLWQRLGLPEPPTILAHGARRHAGEDPDGQLRAAEAELTHSGVLDEAGIPDPAVGRVLRVIAAFSELVDLRCTESGCTEVRALVAADGIRASRLVLADGMAKLDGSPGEAVSALLWTLPDAPAATGPRVEVPASIVDRGVRAALDRGNGSDAAVADELVLLELPARDVAALMRLTCGDRTLYGQIGVTTRDGVHGRRRCADIVQVVDTAGGRAAMWNWDGMLRVAPGTFELFHDLVHELVARARRPIRR